MTQNISCEIISGKRFNEFTYSKQRHFDYFKQKNYDIELYGEIIDPLNCSLITYQELLVYAIIKENVKPGCKLLGIGGTNIRILSHFKNQYECWCLDEESNKKVEGINIIKDSIGNFNENIRDNYFDFVFSISALKNIPDNDLGLFEKIYNDLDRISRDNSYNIHCFDVVIKSDFVWMNKLIYYFFSKNNSLNDFVSIEELRKKSGIFTLPEKYYEENWQEATKKSYKDFGKPLSYNIIWKKEIKEIDLTMETFLKNNKLRLPHKTISKNSDYLKSNPSYVFHHLIKCGGSSIFNILNKWFIVESDYKPNDFSNDHFMKNINMYNKYKYNIENFNSDVCLVAHFDTNGYHLHQRYPEILQKKDTIKIFTFVREPLELAISLYFYKFTKKEQREKLKLKDFLSYHYNLLSIQFPCNEKNYKEVLDRYFFIGLVERSQESMDKLGRLIGKRSVTLPRINKSVKDFQIEEILNDTQFINEYKKRNKIDYLVFEYCKEKYSQMC